MHSNAYFGFDLYPSKKCSASNMNSLSFFTKCFVVSFMFSIFSSFEIPNATSTWKSQVFPTRQTDSVLEFMIADKPGSFSALRPDFFVIPKAVNFELFKSKPF